MDQNDKRDSKINPAHMKNQKLMRRAVKIKQIIEVDKYYVEDSKNYHDTQDI